MKNAKKMKKQNDINPGIMDIALIESGLVCVKII